MIISCLDQTIGATACVLIQLHPAASLTNAVHDFHEIGIIFTSKVGKNWIKSDASEKNAFKSQSFSVLVSQMGLSPLIVVCCKEKVQTRS